jgi:beta-glucosidase
VNGRAGGGGAAASADATIAVLGISSLLEGEEGASVASATRGDRLELGLPENQLDFLRNLRGDHDRPIVVVLTGGSPMTIPEVGELADAIVWAWYPGQQGGNAVADVLFGDANPSGRLPVTFPRSVDQLPPFEDYGMRGRTYRYMTGEPLYPFGYGLTYTSFEYGEVRLSSATVKRGTALEVEVTVKNTGDRDGTEIVQLYLSSNDAGFEVPRSSLVGFRAVAIPAGEERAVRFTVAPEQMKVVNDAGDKVWVNGVHTLEVGGVSPGARGEALTGRPLRSADFTLL